MIGVFLCDCGTNIAGVVDLDAVERRFQDVPEVRVYRHPFMCSEEGQDLVRSAVEAGEVDRVVVASCSPRHHGDVFRAAVEGLEGAAEPVMANIREHCAWVTTDTAEATSKAIALVNAAIARVRTSEALGTFSVPVTDAVAVVGGGIAGMHSALELASRGTRVHLIERGPTLGGLMVLLNRTFPTDDCSICSIAPVLSDVAGEANISVRSLTEVTGLRGRPGAWVLTLTTRPRYVSEDRCTACGECVASTFAPEAPMLRDEGGLIDRIAIDHGACTLCGTCAGVCEASTGGAPALVMAEGCEGPGELNYDTSRCIGCWACLKACPEGALGRVAVCPVVVPRESDSGLGWRHAIYLPNPHSVPLTYVRDPGTCLALTGELECVGCARVCPADAIVVGETEETEIEVGAIVLAPGIQEADLSRTEYHAEHPDVVTALQLERLLSPDGPTQGRLARPSDGQPPGRVVFVQCAGSRSQTHYPHCSRVCCSQAVKNANLIKASWPDTEVTVCYTDIRVSGRDAEEYYDSAREAGVRFIRGSVAEVDVGGPLPVVVTEDTLAPAGDDGGPLRLEADLVVLSTALLPSDGSRALAETLPIATGPLGFIRSVHPKMRPVDLAARGIHVAGSAEFPKFIQDCIAEAGAAAQHAGALASSGELELPRAYPELIVDRCIGCGRCIEECPFEAIEATEDGKVRIVEAACRACGKCVAACLSTALDLRELPLPSLRAEVDAILEAESSARDGPRGPRPVIAYACNSCGYNAADLAGSRRMNIPADVLPVWVPCSGRLSVEDLVHPFTRGAAGVMVAACLPNQCTFIDGNLALADRLEQARELIALMGVSPDRLQLVHTSSADAARFREAAEGMARIGASLDEGPSRGEDGS